MSNSADEEVVKATLNGFEQLCERIQEITEEMETMLEEWEESCRNIEVEETESLSMNRPKEIDKNKEDREKEMEKQMEEQKQKEIRKTYFLFSTDVMRAVELSTENAKQTGENIVEARNFIEATNPQISLKMQKMTQKDIREISQRFTALIDDFSLFRTRLKMKFERLISKQLKALGLAFNKRILNKVLETDYIDTLMAKKHDEKVARIIEYFNTLRGIHSKILTLETSLTQLYDEFSKTAEMLIKREMVFEEIAPPLQEAIDFVIEQRKEMRKKKVDDDTSSSQGIIIIQELGFAHRRYCILKYVLICGIVALMFAIAAMLVVIVTVYITKKNDSKHTQMKESFDLIHSS